MRRGRRVRNREFLAIRGFWSAHATKGLCSPSYQTGPLTGPLESVDSFLRPLQHPAHEWRGLKGLHLIQTGEITPRGSGLRTEKDGLRHLGRGQSVRVDQTSGHVCGSESYCLYRLGRLRNRLMFREQRDCIESKSWSKPAQR